MNRFHFPLAKVMEWRRTRVQVEESALERLYAESRRLEAEAAQIRQEQARAERVVLGAASVTGPELVALSDFRQWTKAEFARLREASADCDKRIAAQVKTVTQKRLDLRLLERLHERKLAAWKKDLEREVDRQAEESNLTKLAGRIRARNQR